MVRQACSILLAKSPLQTPISATRTFRSPEMRWIRLIHSEYRSEGEAKDVSMAWRSRAGGADRLAQADIASDASRQPITVAFDGSRLIVAGLRVLRHRMRKG